MVLPARHDLLRLPRSCHISPDLSRLRLHAWRLSSDFPEPLASTPQSRCSLRWRAVHPRAQYIRCDGPFIVSGITPMAILSLVLPWLRLLTSCIGCGTPGDSCFLSAWLLFSVICGVPFSPSILVFGSDDSGSVTLLPTLFSGACAASPCLGLVYGVDIFCLACLCAFVSGFLPRSSADDLVFCWLLPLPRELVSCRLYLPLSPLWLELPACLPSRSLSPSRSRSPVPSLAPSW